MRSLTAARLLAQAAPEIRPRVDGWPVLSFDRVVLLSQGVIRFGRTVDRFIFPNAYGTMNPVDALSQPPSKGGR